MRLIPPYSRLARALIFCLACLAACPALRAGVDAGLRGHISDASGAAVAGLAVQLFDAARRPLKAAVTDGAGDFDAGSLPFGDYSLQAVAPDGTEADLAVHLASGDAKVVRLTLQALQGEAVVVTGHRDLVSQDSASSRVELSRAQIQALPEGASVSLPKLLTSTSPGMVLGSFGQVFTRGNHANLQYQIDGVQLPDSVSGTFGDAFSPRDIERMEVITGGLPAEYGNRLAGVLNIITRSGPQDFGGDLDIGYGSFGKFAPQLDFGGSNHDGSFRYFATAGTFSTGRGLDTPQPGGEADETQGGREAVHDHAEGHNAFAKLDWRGGADRVTLDLSDSRRYYQIPNYPAGFKPADPFFSDPNFSDPWGNGRFDYRPSGTGDTQAEQEDYVQAAWSRDLGGGSRLQVAPYWKYSDLDFQGDPTNDLAAAGLISGVQATSFSEHRRADNVGVKADLEWAALAGLKVKTGLQLQGSQSSGPVSVATWDGSSNTATSGDDSMDRGWQEGLYGQVEWRLLAGLTANLGLRYDATQFQFSDASSSDALLQPRVGLSWLAWPDTKLHAFYGRLYMPAPVEDLRSSFSAVGGGGLRPYDIKAEKDDYTEAGLDQQFGEQLLAVNV